MSSDLVAIESRLWAATDQRWANAGLKPAEFSTPVLGLIFLRYADKRFSECAQLLHAKGVPADERQPMDFQAEGVLYLPEQARFSHLLTPTEGTNLGKAIASAMSLLEGHNPGLPADAYAQAVEQPTQDRSKQNAVNANRGFYRLLKDGVKVKVGVFDT
jgi:type I restriction enzyme M protein